MLALFITVTAPKYPSAVPKKVGRLHRNRSLAEAARRAVSGGRHASGPAIPLTRQAWPNLPVRTIRGEKPLGRRIQALAQSQVSGRFFAAIGGVNRRALVSGSRRLAVRQSKCRSSGFEHARARVVSLQSPFFGATFARRGALL
jgi:hypothetical protein